MRHVCFLTSLYSRHDPLIVYRQGASLVKSGYKVSYLLVDGKSDEEVLGVSIKSIANYPKPSIKQRLIDCNRIFKLFLNNYSADIYQINEPELFPTAIFLKKKGYKVVYNLREYYPIYYSHRIKFKPLRYIAKYLLIKIFKQVSIRIDAVFSCMPEMLNIQHEMPCKFFANVANFPIINRDFSLSYEQYLNRECIISYFGSIYDISCQEEFLKAIEDIEYVKYLLAGVFCSKNYKKYITSLRGWEKVIFKEGFTRNELQKIINSSVIGNVMKDFSKTETPQGSYSIIKIFETMEAAVPVLLAKVPLYVNMVEKYHCGICVDPHNSQEIKEAIIYLLNNKNEAYQMGQNGRKAVIDEFSWDSQFSNYLSVITILINENGKK